MNQIREGVLCERQGIGSIKNPDAGREAAVSRNPTLASLHDGEFIWDATKVVPRLFVFNALRRPKKYLLEDSILLELFIGPESP